MDYVDWIKKNFANNDETVYQHLLQRDYANDPTMSQTQSNFDRLWPNIVNGLRSKQASLINIKAGDDATVAEMRKAVTSKSWLGNTMTVEQFTAKYGKNFRNDPNTIQAAYDFLKGSQEQVVTVNDLKTGIAAKLAAKAAGMASPGGATRQANP
jgi:beta-phosphoglucomutase-like phosphatase (HAD superfamily)